MRLLIVANPDKPEVTVAFDRLVAWIRTKVEIVGIDSQQGTDPIHGHADADALLVLGGDGTLLSAARRLHGKPIPIFGVNFGRLGFLAGFTPREFEEQFDAFIAGRLPISRRQVIDVSVLPPGAGEWTDASHVVARRRFFSPALNDAVITAGPAFHMIELEITVAPSDARANGGGAGVRYFGDGVIVSTASGSTAYNVSAGGPIISPSVQAMCITPLCPHSLSFRPVVISNDYSVLITASRVNEGTALFCDGQESTRLTAGERVVIRTGPHPVLLVENPHAGEWHNLARKLNWASSPAHNARNP